MYAPQQNISVRLCLLLLAVLIVYMPGLPGSFLFDDAVNLTNNPRFVFTARGWDNIVAATFSSTSGPLQRPISMFTLALNQYFSGLDDVVPYKLTNILIHCLNTLAVFFVARQITRLAYKNRAQYASDTVALLAAGLWGLHPFNLTSVLYIVQRMTSLATLFSLASLYTYLHGRELMLAGRRQRGYLFALGWSSFLCLVGIFSKETAILTPALWCLCEIWFLRFQGQEGRVEHTLRLLYQLGFTAAVFTVGSYWLLHPDFLSTAYTNRSFTLSERLLTESRVVWFYLGQTLVPHLPSMGLQHDDFEVSRSLLSPPATWLAVAGWSFLVAALLIRPIRTRWPVLSFAAAWYVVGHSLESSFWPLELVHEHRNYLPGLGPLWALAYYLTVFLNRLPVGHQIRRAAYLIPLAILGASTYTRAAQWGNPIEHSLVEASNHPNSPRSTYAAGQTYINLYKDTHERPLYDLAMESFRRSVQTASLGTEMGYIGLLYAPFLVGNYPARKDIEAYAETLRKSPAYAVNISQLTVLVDCQTDGTCRLKDQDFFLLTDALLSNPLLPKDYSSNVHIILGNYYANKLGDFATAAKHIQQAVALSPNDIHHRLNWLSYLVATGQQAPAQAELANIRAMKDAWRYTQRLELESNKLSAAQRATQEKRP